jgi:hypothetical protein
MFKRGTLSSIDVNIAINPRIIRMTPIAGVKKSNHRLNPLSKKDGIIHMTMKVIRNPVNNDTARYIVCKILN